MSIIFLKIWWFNDFIIFKAKWHFSQFVESLKVHPYNLYSKGTTRIISLWTTRFCTKFCEILEISAWRYVPNVGSEEGCHKVKLSFSMSWLVETISRKKWALFSYLEKFFHKNLWFESFELTALWGKCDFYWVK